MHFHRVLTMAAAATVVLSGAVSASAVSSTPIAAYSIAAPHSVAASGLVARAVVPAGATCPDLMVNGRALRTHIRLALPSTTVAFAPILVCERVVPTGGTRASIGGLAIPAAMPTRVDHMVMFGDTGCSIQDTVVQDCADPAQWPLARISRRIAMEKPDVILFTGDFFYRETACLPEYTAWCGASPPPITGAPFTDSAYGWMADVITPMTPMLRTAPIVMTSGNHEACNRAGNGFFLLMDPRPVTRTWCDDPSAPPTSAYAIDLPLATAKGRTLRLVVADSASGSDTHISSAGPALRTMYEGGAALAAPAAGRESWLVTHRPIFGLVAPSLAGEGSPWTSVDQTAATVGLLGRYRMIVSAHVHLAQAVQIPGQPGQIVLGNGGTALDPPSASAPPYGPLSDPGGAPVSSALTPYPTASSVWSASTFGYATATPGARAGTWRVAHRDDSGKTFATCTLTGRALTCRGS
ncbi:MAG: metallophosphoesterase [Miltoncostaeaceae bacterium]